MILLGFGHAPEAKRLGYKFTLIVNGTEAAVRKVFDTQDVIIVQGAMITDTEAEFYLCTKDTPCESSEKPG